MPEYTGIYRGSVHDIADPEERGRLRLLVPQVLGGSPSAWAEPTLRPSASADVAVGDRVWVQFEGGDINRPTYHSRQEVSAADLSEDLSEEVAPQPVTISPTPTVKGGIRTLMVEWGQSPATEVEVHISTNESAVITPGDEDTLVGVTGGTGWMIDQMPDGTPLEVEYDSNPDPDVSTVVDRTYYVWLIGRNDLTPTGAAPNGPVAGQLKRITSEDVSVEAVWAGYVQADRMLAGEMKVLMRLASDGEIIATGAGGQSVSLSGTGFLVTGPTSLGNPTYVSFPTDGRPNIIGGELNATILTVEGDSNGVAAKFRQNSLFEVGATLTLNDTTAPPSGSPVLEAATDIRPMTGGPASDANLGCGVWNGGEYYFTWNRNDGSVIVYRANPSTGLIAVYADIAPAVANATCRGITRTAAGWFMVWVSNVREPGTAPTIYITKHDLSSAMPLTLTLNIGTLNIGTTVTPDESKLRWSEGVALSTDGTDLWVGTLDHGISGSVAFPRYRRYLADLSSATPQETIVSNSPVGSTSMQQRARIHGFYVGNMDFGSRRIAATLRDYGGFNYHSIINDSGNTVGADHFEMQAGESTHAWLGWDGTRFWEFARDSSGWRMIQYSRIKWASSSKAIYGWYAYHRTSDNAQTSLSNRADLIHPSRWFIKMTGQTAPTGLVVRFYVNDVSNASASSKLQSTLAAGALTATYDVFTNGATPYASGFTAGTPASIRSQASHNIYVDGVTTLNGSKNVSSAGNKFRDWMAGQSVTGIGIPLGTTVTSVTSRGALVLSNSATVTGTTNLTFVNQPLLLFQGDGYGRLQELENLILSSTNDASLNAGNKPPLRIGDVNADHLRIDGDEIIAMASDTTKGDLTMNVDNLVFNLGNGNLEMSSTVNMRGRLRTNFGAGVALVFKDNQIVAGVETHNATSNTAGNTAPFHANEVHAWGGGFYDEALSGGGATTAQFSGAGRLVRATLGSYTTSLREIKDNIRDMRMDEAEALLRLRPRVFQDKRDPEENRPWVSGFIAEEAAEAGADLWVGYDPDTGEIAGLRYEQMVAGILMLMQDVYAKIEER